MPPHRTLPLLILAAALACAGPSARAAEDADRARRALEQGEIRPLDEAVAWMERLGVTHLRTGLSWADSFRPNALDWFDRQMEALADFQVTATFCFTPEHRGIAAHHTSAPLVRAEFSEFCAAMVRRYADPVPVRAEAVPVPERPLP